MSSPVTADSDSNPYEIAVTQTELSGTALLDKPFVPLRNDWSLSAYVVGFS